MKITIARKKLQAKGYHVTSVMNGGYVAVKGQRRYMATSINGLVNQIFKSI